jgi:Flp pilus assembly protein TadG
MTVQASGRRRRDERGSFTLFTILWSLLIVMLAALAIDGGLAITQRERAADLADQAARTEAQNLSQPDLRKNGTVLINDDGCGLADSYVRSMAPNVHYGTAKVEGCDYSPAGVQPSSVTVHVQLTYTPFVFDIFGGTLTVNEQGTAFAQAGD